MIGELSVHVRTQYDFLPEELFDGLESYVIDPEWQWVVEQDGRIVAQVLACYAHGITILLRISATQDAPKSWAVVALRQVLRDCRERGCIGFLTMLEDNKKQEVKLMRIVQKIGGYVRPFYGAIVAGTTDLKY